MSEAIKAQVGYLVELKRIDDQGYRIKVGLAEIPKEISEIDRKVELHEAQFAAARGAVVSLEKKLRDTERELKSKEEELHKAEGKMMEVKTNAEYLAAMKENEGRKAQKGEIEEIVLSLMDLLETERKNLKALENEGLSDKTQLLSQKKSLESQSTQLQADLEQIAQKRDTHALQLDEKLRALYKKLSNENDRPISFTQNGQCSACNMQVRPQIYNEIVGYVAIHSCGSCRRLLVPIPTPSPTQMESSANLSTR